MEIIASCILLGEIHYGERSGFDISFVENMKGTFSSIEKFFRKVFLEVDNVSRLLQISSRKLIEALTQPSIRIGDSIIQKNQGLKKVKIIFEKLIIF